jgi:hypothetical protein
MQKRKLALALETCGYLVSFASTGFRSDPGVDGQLFTSGKLLLDNGVVVRARILLPRRLLDQLREMRMSGLMRAPVNPVNGARRLALWDLEGRMRPSVDGTPILHVSGINGLDRVESKDGLLNLLETVDPA